MKHILLTLTLVLAFTSCSHSKQIKEAGIIADSFLAAYCSGDYDAAAALCSEPLKTRILNTSDLTAGMDTAAASAAVDIMKGIKWDRSVVETEEKTDEVIFTCSTSYNGRSCSYTVTLEPAEKSWVIAEIN